MADQPQETQGSPQDGPPQHGPPQHTEFEIQVPPELEAGSYANFLMVWHTPHEFTLDFAVMQPSQPPQPDQSVVKVPCRVVTRLRVPPTVMLEVLHAMNENLNRYQSMFGEVRRPGGGESGPSVPDSSDRPGAGGYH
jgi:hypothetical protein